MSEKLHSVEHDRQPDETPGGHEAHPKQTEHTKDDISEKLDIKKTRELIDEIHQASGSNQDEPDNSGATSPRVPLPDLQPLADAVAKTWRSIRQNLNPSERRYSRFIHNAIVSNVSEFTARTLARPYAILTGGLTALIGSAIYLYYTRHLGYHYNFFVPIFLFAGGLGVGVLAEIFYITAISRRQK